MPMTTLYPCLLCSFYFERKLQWIAQAGLRNLKPVIFCISCDCRPVLPGTFIIFHVVLSINYKVYFQYPIFDFYPLKFLLEILLLFAETRIPANIMLRKCYWFDVGFYGNICWDHVCPFVCIYIYISLCFCFSWFLLDCLSISFA